ncbi:Single-stranded DNA-binding protein [Aquisphaera giovannonii]|uniref:Single-stranded DNA-binding protein n=1 Tax=Aquisphaera giovannonii TaxID=406548 RepID=A0A5B9W1P0_9BACT|nr:single-stranded DNA-binding protein [Aquisphaera giovannonii]QEH34177.1 Single-stranded DNA-binding protein [Aquisphaera giovannonii]
MADLNKVFLMGRLTFDPELRRTPSGTAVAELRMATSRGWTDREGGRREETLFIDVTVWDRAAENCCQYLRKGSQIHVEGSLKMDTWEDKTTGQKREKIRVHADRVQFLDSKRSDSGGGGDYGSGDDEAAPAPPPREPARRSSGPPNGAGATRGGYSQSSRPSRPPVEPEQEEDDIPF